MITLLYHPATGKWSQAASVNEGHHPLLKQEGTAEARVTDMVPAALPFAVGGL